MMRASRAIRYHNGRLIEVYAYLGNNRLLDGEKPNHCFPPRTTGAVYALHVEIANYYLN